MYLSGSLLSLIFGVLGTASVITFDITQAPLDHGRICDSVADTGFKGPGYYQILSLQAPNDVAVSVPGSTDVNVSARKPVVAEAGQNWLFADIGSNNTLIINRLTGGLLTALGREVQTTAILSPISPSAVWKIDASQGYKDGAIVLYNAATNLVLDLQGESTKVGTAIISYPLKKGSGRGTNQAWLLQYIGAPP